MNMNEQKEEKIGQDTLLVLDFIRKQEWGIKYSKLVVDMVGYSIGRGIKDSYDKDAQKLISKIEKESLVEEVNKISEHLLSKGYSNKEISLIVVMIAKKMVEDFDAQNR